MRGIVISLEGVEGSGKSTQAEHLREGLQEASFKVALVREPGGTDLSEKLREVLLSGGESARVDPLAELFLYLAARRQLVKERLEPMLEKGFVVLCDRFTDATIAYQAGGRRLPEGLVNSLNQLAAGSVRPALTIYLDLDPEEGLRRIRRSKQLFDRLEREGMDFHRRVRRSYLELAGREPERVRVFDARREEAVLKREILNTVMDFLTHHRED